MNDVNKVYVELVMSERWGVIASGIFDKDCKIGEVLTILDAQVRGLFTAKNLPYIPYHSDFFIGVPIRDFSKRLKDFPSVWANGAIQYDQLYLWASFPRDFILYLNRTKDRLDVF
jgi:hypothetical protein